jgi:hypothetical protein
MDVIADEVVEFFPHTFKSKAGKDTTVQKMNLKGFGPVSLGFTKPETLPFAEGDHVVINVEKKFGEYQYQGEAPAGATPTLTAPLASAPRGGGGGGKPGFAMVPKVFPVPPKHGDMAIIHQNSLTNARAYVAELTSAGVAPYADMTDDERVAAIVAMAYRFADFSSGADLLSPASE